MKRRTYVIIAFVLLASISLITAVTSQGQQRSIESGPRAGIVDESHDRDPVTPAQVIRMVQARVPKSLIVQRIRSRNARPLSVEELVDLCQRDVSTEVIAAMQELRPVEDNPEHFETLQGTMFPGTSVNFATVTEVMAFVYGIAIPVLVLILWAVAGGLLKRAGKITRPAMGCFIGGTFLLLLSMYHCTESLMLFGLPWYMAFAYAFGIDWGLVSLEIGQLFSSDVEI